MESKILQGRISVSSERELSENEWAVAQKGLGFDERQK